MGGGRRETKKNTCPSPCKGDMVALLRTTEREAIDELVFRRGEVEAKVED